MSHDDSLVLDIGADTGALVIYADPEQNEAEIEISSDTDPTVTRNHNVMHARHTRWATVYSAVFPSVAAGDYTIWGPNGSPRATVTVRGGQVTEHHW